MSWMVGTMVRAWHGPVSALLADQALDLAREVAMRLVDTDRVLESVVGSAEKAAHPTGWYFPGFAHGHAGLALVPLHTARVAGTDSERAALLDTAFGFIRDAFTGTRAEPLDSASIFFGISGLALALTDFAAKEPRFRPSLDRLHGQLAEKVVADNPPRVERGVVDSDYDMVSGAAGVLAYLSSVDDPGNGIRDAAACLVDYLIWLGEPPDDPTLRWRWLIAPEHSPSSMRGRAEYAGGYLNLGMSHGIPGVIAALAAAWRAGYRRPGHEAALERMIDWVLSVRCFDEIGPMWPADVPLGDVGVRLGDVGQHDQLAWCYGTAGVSAGLLLAADAVGDDRLRRVAIEAFEAVLLRTRHTPITSATLCHGMAGVLAICLEFAAVTSSARAREFVPVLLADLIAFADRDRPLVFVDEDEPGNRVDSPALLTGASGVALTLLAAVAPCRPVWLRAFLAR